MVRGRGRLGPPAAGHPLASEERLLALVDLIYAAVDDPAAWSLALAAVGEALGASKGGLHRFDHRNLAGSSFYEWGFDPDFVASYARHYSRVNLRTLRGGHLLVPGRIVTSDQQYPDEMMLGTEFAADWLLPQKIFHSFGITLQKDGGATWNLTFFRPLEDGQFASNDTRLLTALAPHLQRAIQLQVRLHGLQSRSSALAESIEQIAMGVILVDASGRVSLANRTARAILRAADSVTVTDGELTAVDPAVTAALRRLLTDAVATAASERLGRGGGTVLVPRRSGKRDLEMLVAPLAADPLGIGFAGVGAVVFLTEPDDEIPSLEDHLRQHYRLTAAECRLVNELLAFQSLVEAADRLHITEGTARTHLKRILAKTGTRGQTELVRLLMRSIPVLAHRSPA